MGIKYFECEYSNHARYSHSKGFVELAGVEPASGQATTMLSTCLAISLIFEIFLRISTLKYPYLLNFASEPERHTSYPLIPAPLNQTTKGLPSEGCLASASNAERGVMSTVIRLMQLKRNCFRQLFV